LKAAQAPPNGLEKGRCSCCQPRARRVERERECIHSKRWQLKQASRRGYLACRQSAWRGQGGTDARGQEFNDDHTELGAEPCATTPRLPRSRHYRKQQLPANERAAVGAEIRKNDGHFVQCQNSIARGAREAFE